jgi:hypothetical protein
MHTPLIIAVAIAACGVGLAGCAPAWRPAPRPPRAAPAPLAPFEESPVSFIVAGPRFTPGEVTIVKVCIADDRSIVSADILESSGDKRFDDLAVVWARQVKVRSVSQLDRPIGHCGEVRVEIRSPNEPRVIAGPDAALG